MTNVIETFKRHLRPLTSPHSSARFKGQGANALSERGY